MKKRIMKSGRGGHIRGPLGSAWKLVGFVGDWIWKERQWLEVDGSVGGWL